MAGRQKLVVLLSVLAAIGMGLCIQSLASKKQPLHADSAAGQEASGTAPQELQIPQYANDIDRLNQLTDSVNRAFGRCYVTTLGAGGDSPVAGGLVSVDYAVFDRLSDDGAAVLIAEAAVASRIASLQTQVVGNAHGVILRADESVGRCMARAGFKPEGFGEWLNARSSYDQKQDEPPESMRTSAFMRGYLMEQRRRQTQVSSTSR
jgi:hypothetical protein